MLIQCQFSSKMGSKLLYDRLIIMMMSEEKKLEINRPERRMGEKRGMEGREKKEQKSKKKQKKRVNRIQKPTICIVK